LQERFLLHVVEPQCNVALGPAQQLTQQLQQMPLLPSQQPALQEAILQEMASWLHLPPNHHAAPALTETRPSAASGS
jgi:hypothetical protein